MTSSATSPANHPRPHLAHFAKEVISVKETGNRQIISEYLRPEKECEEEEKDPDRAGGEEEEEQDDVGGGDDEDEEDDEELREAQKLADECMQRSQCVHAAGVEKIEKRT